MNDLHPNTVADIKINEVTKAECRMAAEKSRWNEHLQAKIDYVKKLEKEKTRIKSSKLRLESDERQKTHDYALDAAIHSGVTAAVIAATI